MRTKYTRQTRWASGPEDVDPAHVPPGSTYARVMVWAACTECDLQVHATCVERLARGLVCPECGRQVAAPVSPEEQEASIENVEREEARFHQRLQP